MNETTLRTESGPLKYRKQTFFQKIGPVYYALLLLLVVGAVTQPTFISLRNLRNVIISGTFSDSDNGSNDDTADSRD
jgi:cell division septal protein FtsQ